MFGLSHLRFVNRFQKLRSVSSLPLLKGGNKCFINNSWVASADGKTFDVLNPATNEIIGSVPDMPAQYLDEAVNVAHKAFKKWKNFTVLERSSVMKMWHELLKKNHEELSRLITLENGKTLRDARAEMSLSADFVEWFAEESKRIYGDVISSTSNQKRFVTIKQPLGVAGLITPWNFPSAMITRKVSPALAAGCTVVIKPSDETPFSALALCQLALEAGFPEGVINVVTCSKDKAPMLGEHLCNNPRVAKISFTGSTDVGKVLLRNSSSTVKRSSMELGGNAAFIIFDSANVDAAVSGVMNSKFRCSGQTCVCPNRLLVQKGVHDKFVKKLSEAVSSLKVGNGLSEGTSQGPLINRNAVDKVSKIVTDAVSKGAKVVTGGKPLDDQSNFFPPTILTNVSAKALCAKEEIFGPVAPIFEFETEDEAIQIANTTPFGLAGYFYSNDISQIWRVAEAMEVGMVGVNESIFSGVQTPFGGIKESGFGREGSKYGIEEYLNIKFICFGGI